MRRRRPHDRGQGIFWGVVLVAMGVAFLLSEKGILPRHLLWSWWMWWPAVMIALGLYKITRPRDASEVGGGVTMILIALWLLANYNEWWGLTWRTSWPIALVAVGMGMVVRAVASGVMRDRTDPTSFDPRKEEDSHVE
jgi:Domain of unknown function (DUF5668)